MARSGNFRRTLNGYIAFFPADLPPEPPVTLDGDLGLLLSAADRARRVPDIPRPAGSVGRGARRGVHRATREPRRGEIRRRAGSRYPESDVPGCMGSAIRACCRLN